MLTDQERAKKIVKDRNWYGIDYMRVGPDGDEMPIDTIDDDLLQEEIAAAIRDAVAAERERCAQVCDERARVATKLRFRADDGRLANGFDLRAHEAANCAAAIRQDS